MDNLEILLDDYKGKTFSQKLKDSMLKHALESKYKIFGYTPRFMESALVTVVSPENELKGVSTSKMIIGKNGKPTADLLTDNFGAWFAGIMGDGGFFRDVIQVDEASLSFTTRGYTVSGGTGQGLWNDTSIGAGSCVAQIGADPTAVARSDVAIGVPFGVGPQAGKIVPQGNGGWNSGLGIAQVSYSIVTSTLGGAIEECGLFADLGHLGAPNNSFFMWAHDNISQLIFIAGETVNIDYTFTL